MSTLDREARIAKIFASLREALPKRPEAPPVKPAPRVVEREVRVAPCDPNFSAANGGRVQVDIYEEMYWSAVDRAFNPQRFAEVVSAYDPYAKKLMPGYDPEDR
jgi:hypothetical protein